jgi:VIT1/CCC1 family predicted Fe2+/Mn2+ transporter
MAVHSHGDLLLPFPAFMVRALAAAWEALSALARLSSGVIFSARAFPPILPAKAITSDMRRVVLVLGVVCFLDAFLLMMGSRIHRCATVKQAKIMGNINFMLDKVFGTA